MSNLKCPFCQQELQETFGIKQFWCSNYYNHTHPINLQGTKELWQELIRTRKALDVAVDALDTVRQYYRGTAVVRPNNIAAYCDNKIDKIKEITALEQKE